nr:AvrRpt2Ea [Erwinia amylovora]
VKVSHLTSPAPVVIEHQPRQSEKVSRDGDVIKPWSQLPAAAPSFGGCFGKSKKSRGYDSGSSSGSRSNAGFRLNHVPYVSQQNERMGCWYACTRMLGHSISSGPRLGLPELYDSSGPQGLQQREDVLRLMRNENLAEVSLPESRQFSANELGNLLSRHGPIMFGWQTPAGSWHMSVLTGIDKPNDAIIFHDPQRGPDLTMPLDSFNQRLAWRVPHAMLYSEN